MPKSLNETQTESLTAFVIHPYLPASEKTGGGESFAAPKTRDIEAALAEAVSLMQAIDAEVKDGLIFKLTAMRPATLIGKGQAESLGQRIADEKIKLVMINHPLTPGQQHNLEKLWRCKVIDRTGLILEIFGRRAQTHEGRLQVELAALEYQKGRLVRTWTHLERQRGGGGFLAGPGERQLEIDRRLVRDRITRLKKELSHVQRTRSLGRRARRRVPYPVVALVGYTNAGKSTLFNRLSGADVFAKDLLFATLDPTMRAIPLPSHQQIILADTVGFISDLPTHLVAAFRATLEEVEEADIILHVRDISHPETEAQKQDVEAILKSLNITDKARERLIEVWNKDDLLPEDERKALQQKLITSDEAVVVSALTGDGIGDLLKLIDQKLRQGQDFYEITLPVDHVDQGAALAWLYRHGDILTRKDLDTAIFLTLRLDRQRYGQFQHQFGASLPLNPISGPKSQSG